MKMRTGFSRLGLVLMFAVLAAALAGCILPPDPGGPGPFHPGPPHPHLPPPP